MLGDPDLHGPGFKPAEEIGVHGVTGDNIYFDPSDETLYGNIKVFSTVAQKEVLPNGINNISLGYRCKYLPQSGVAPDGTPYDYIQVQMRGNHSAFVKDGRCGEEISVMDGVSEDAFISCFDEKDLIPMAKSLKERNAKAFNAGVKKVVGAYAKAAIAKAKLRSGVSPIALANYAMDAADDEAVASEPGLSDVAEMLADVLPQIADINASISDASAPDPLDGTDDDMEPDIGEDGKPKMGMDGKPIMKKKAAPAPVAPAKAMDKVAMDAAIEAATKPLLAEIAALKNDGTKTVLSEISTRNALASKLSDFIGTFDHAEMTLAEVAKYGVKKLEIPTMDGQEVSALQAWLHGRAKPQKPAYGIGLDGADPKKSPIKAYLTPKEAA